MCVLFIRFWWCLACSSTYSLWLTVSTWINLVILAMITVTIWINLAVNRSVDVQWIPPSSPLYFVASLHTRLRNVRRVQKRTCTQCTGVYLYAEERECTLIMRLYKPLREYKLFMCDTESFRPDDDLYDVTEALQPYISICNFITVYVILQNRPANTAIHPLMWKEKLCSRLDM